MANYASKKTKSLHDFMEALNGDTVRSNNLFEMRVFIPIELRNYIGPIGQALTNYLNPDFTYYGQGFEIPGRSMEYQTVGFKGYTVPVPTVMKMDQEHTVTLNCDIEGRMRRAFLAWQSTTMNPTIRAGEGYFEGNRLLKDTSIIKIYLLNPTYGGEADIHRVNEIYTIYGVTIENVGPITVSNTEANIATFQVKFRSQYWQYGDSTDATRGKSYNTSEELNKAYNVFSGDKSILNDIR